MAQFTKWTNDAVLANIKNYLSNAKLWLADQKSWSVNRPIWPTFLWGRIHFVNCDLSTHRACIVTIEHRAAVKRFYKLIQELIVEAREGGRSQLCWCLNATARKYLNTTSADASKIGRWRDLRDRRTKRWLEKKHVKAGKTGLLHMSSPLPAHESKSEGSRNGDGACQLLSCSL